MRPEKLRFLVIGCGSIGKRHIGNLIGLGVRDIIAFDTQTSRQEEVKKRFGITALNSLDEVWKRKPNVVVIAVPTSLHIPLALDAAEHGCHLFIEKPLSHTMNGVDALLRVVEERKLVALVGCNMRFHPGIVCIKRLINEGAVGKVVAARVEVGQYLPDWHPWEDYRKMYSARQELGGGVILDAIHEIDYVHWILGEVTEVTCFTGKLSHLEIETEDVAAILLRFSSSAIGEIHLDYVQRVYSRSCHIIGDEATIRWDWNEDSVRWYSAARGKWEFFENPQTWKPNQMYIDEMSHFLSCICAESTPSLDIEQAREVLQVALAAKRSAAMRKPILLAQKGN